MEPDLPGEDSVESISRLVYEPLLGTNSNSTPTFSQKSDTSVTTEIPQDEYEMVQISEADFEQSDPIDNNNGYSTDDGNGGDKNENDKAEGELKIEVKEMDRIFVRSDECKENDKKTLLKDVSVYLEPEQNIKDSEIRTGKQTKTSIEVGPVAGRNVVSAGVSLTISTTTSLPKSEEFATAVTPILSEPIFTQINNNFLLTNLTCDNVKTGDIGHPDTLFESQLEQTEVSIGANAAEQPSPVEDKSLVTHQRIGRSSTPMSREFLALQRSVNESKILSEFVTDTAVVKIRKRRRTVTKSCAESTLLKERLECVATTNSNSLEENSKLPYSLEKPKKSKFAPLKDEPTTSTYVKPRCRSRSRSCHRKSPVTDFGTPNLKRWSSSEKISKRTNMRSQNLDFAQKQKDFLNRLKNQDGESYDTDERLINGNDVELPGGSIEGLNENTDTRSSIEQTDVGRYGVDVERVKARLKAIWQAPPKRGWDSFCWKCRESRDVIPCSKCVRSFHLSCIKVTTANKLDVTWICPECVNVENVLNGLKRSRRNETSSDMISQLLSFALKRMKNVRGYPKFLYDEEELSHFSKYIVNPVTFSMLQEKIEKRAFRCSEEFHNETKWLLHNALILSNGVNNKEIFTAKAILKICRQETTEIDTCAECYLNANTRSDWFVDVCGQPHLLLWAKLKGFPYWPAKAMGVGQGSHVNVRFFGEHDRAFVPVKDCFLYSEQDPNTQTGKRSARELADCIKEVEKHIEKIKAKVGAFKYAPYKVPYEPSEEMHQLECMMPGVTEYIKRQQMLVPKPSLQYKIVKTADNNLSIIKKASTTDSSNDSEHTSSPAKKMNCSNNISNDVETCKRTNSTTKYEVISKTSLDDTNSSKVSAVILKRKSVGGDAKKNDGIESPLSKVVKRDEFENNQSMHLISSNADIQCSATGNKRRHAYEIKSSTRVAHGERHKSQNAKQQPRVPMLTIKTNGAKPVETTPFTKESTKPENNAQNVMEKLVKNKVGVTIKKLPKENTKTKGIPVVVFSNDTKLHSEVIAPATKKSVKSEKAGQKTKNILKDLVPFVEIKQEVISENENTADVRESGNINIKGGTDIYSRDTVPTTETAETESAVEKVMFTTVKQEVLSDDEDPSISVMDNNTSIQSILHDVAEKSSEMITTSAMLPDSVRVVGDTTIQRITAKHHIPGASAGFTNKESSVSPELGVVNTQLGASNKRTAVRGVPYGPLPASVVLAAANNLSSAATKVPSNSSTDSPKQHQQLQQQQQLPSRACKSFSNTSSASQTPSLPPSPAAAPCQDIKRTLIKNSMVSIPHQVWSKSPSPQRNSANISNNPIPVPPLTAVSKTSTGEKSSSGVTCTPTTVALAATSGTFLNCNGGGGNIVNGASANIAMSGNASLLSTLNIATPPPLAGLSQTTNVLTNTGGINAANLLPPMSVDAPPLAMANITLNNNSGSIPVSIATSTDHVQPGMMAMMTDALCRGLPRIAPRPNGPLQSDGVTMFPSQSGPVCQTLVENAHKLTDFFISVMEDTMLEMSVAEKPVLQAKITMLQIELERTKSSQAQEIAELKRKTDLKLSEMRKSVEIEKTRLINDIRKQCEQERIRSVEETKKKQWCANCGSEAQFYCCWNTSYCDYPCQQIHWSRHAATCAQARSISTNAEIVGNGNSGGIVTTAGNFQTVHGQQRQLNLKSQSTGCNLSITTSVTTKAVTQIHNKNVISNMKKEKLIGKSIACSTHNSPNNHGSNIKTLASVSSGATNLGLTTATATEMFKLPNNTLVRSIPTQSNNNVRGSAYQMPLQRVNIPLPIAALVQRGNSWELTSAATSNSGSNVATITTPVTNGTPTVTQLTPQQAKQQQQQSHVHQQQKHHHHQRNSGGTLQKNHLLSTRAQQQSINQMHTNSASGMQCNMLRPTQM